MREVDFYSIRNIQYKTIKIIELKDSEEKLRLSNLEELGDMMHVISPWDLVNHIPFAEFLETEEVYFLRESGGN